LFGVPKDKWRHKLLQYRIDESFRLGVVFAPVGPIRRGVSLDVAFGSSNSFRHEHFSGVIYQPFTLIVRAIDVQMSHY
jgi:hypothetical protein